MDILFAGSKKQITKTLKNLVRLYSSFSSEVIYVLLDLLLKASDSVKVSLDRGQTVFNEWKRVMTKFSNKEPDVLLSLLKAVLERIETEGAVKYEAGKLIFLIFCPFDIFLLLFLLYAILFDYRIGFFK